MGWVQAISPCLVCNRVFTYNPHRVPSFRSEATGQREPVCGPCIEWINYKRKERGLDPFEIPSDAYEPLPEEEL